jgi:lauroyl/myristoyl acyltransferase
MGMGWKGRVETTVRRATPTAAVPGLVRRRTAKALEDPAAMADARRQMEFLLGLSAPDSDLDAIAERYVHLMKWRGEARWHPELLTHHEVDGLEHWHEARGDGRGVLVSFSHHGFYDGVFGSLSRVGIPCRSVVTPTMFDGTAPAWMAQQFRVANIGVPAVNADIGVPGFVELLEQGDVLGVATDVPAGSRMTFLGREVRGAFGTAYVAKKFGYPVVQVSASPAPDNGPHPTQRLTLSPVIDPDDHADARSILAVIVAGLETAVAAWPEGYDQPLKRWTWEPASVDA